MILGQDGDSEFVINRQNAKIQFLQNENNQLQEDNKDLQKALKLNKDALKIAYEQQQNASKSTKESTLNEPYGYTATAEILEKQIGENKILLNTYQRCFTERKELATRNLILQQINEETSKFFKDVIHDLEEKVLELRRIIQDKEYTIQTLEKKIYLPDKDGVLLKIKEVVSPNEQTIPLHAEIQKNKMQCDKLNEQIQALGSENESLKQSNLYVKHEMVKLVAVFHSAQSHQNLSDFLKIQNSNTTQDDQNLDAHKDFFSTVFSLKNWNQKSASDENKSHLFSHELFNELQNQSFYNTFENTKQSQKLNNVGNYQQQQQQQSSIKSPRSPHSRMDLLNKTEQLETNMTKLKKLYFKSSKNTKILTEKLLERKSEFNRLNLQIKTLQKSNRSYEVKFKNLQEITNFFKQFFQNYMIDLQQRRRNSVDQGKITQGIEMMQKLQKIQQQQSQDDDEDDIDLEEQQIAQQHEKQEFIENFLDNLKEEDNKDQQQQQTKNMLECILGELFAGQNGQGCFSKESVKQLIKNISIEIKNLRVELMPGPSQQTQNIIQKQGRNKRSLSNPLEYFNVQIGEKKETIKNWHISKRILEKEKKISNRKFSQEFGNQNKFNNNNDNKGSNNNNKNNTPFFVDMSMIGGPEMMQQQNKFSNNNNKKQQQQQQQKQQVKHDEEVEKQLKKALSKINNNNKNSDAKKQNGDNNNSFMSNNDDGEQILNFD